MNKFLIVIYRRYFQDEIPAVAAQMSYYILLAFVPFLIFLLSLIGNINLPESEYLIYNSLETILPEQSSYNLIVGILEEVTKGNSSSIFNIFITLYFASMGTRAIMTGINKAYNENESRPLLKLWGLSFIFTITLAILLVISLFALVLGNIIGNAIFKFLELPFDFIVLWENLRYFISIGLMLLIITFIYQNAPNCKLYIRDVIWGSIFSTIGWTLASQVFAYYVNNFNKSYSLLYGSLAGVFALLIWIYISINIILIGGEINAYLYNNKKGRFPCK